MNRRLAAFALVMDFPLGPIQAHQNFIDQANQETTGFSRMGAVYLPFDGPINTNALPDTLTDSLEADARVFLVNVDRTSSRYAERIPIYTRWQEEPAVYLPGNLLTLLPYQGIPYPRRLALK